MHDLLFVYGTLITSARHPKGERLRADATLLGTATLQARLYRVSWYPGITLSSDPADRVHGEVYRLAMPTASLTWLDEYEGLTQGAQSVAPGDDYARRVCRVAFDAGGVVDAWVYLFLKDTAALEQVTDGRWRG